MDISAELIDQIVAHAREEAPNECCGIVGVLPGRDGAQPRAVRVFRAENIHKSPKRFEIDGKAVLAAMRELEDSSLEIGSIYHSHTHTAPYPSQTDINFAANWPGVEWVIVGLSDPSAPEIRSYLIEEGVVREVALEQIAV